MSIKKFFEKQRQDSRNYADYADEKSTFEDVESQHNAKALVETKNTHVPQVDYSQPENFVKFGSAYMYYSGALNRIVDYYPYDGSKAERNEFYNKLFDVEKYVFNNLYPRFNGYANFSAGGVSFVSKSADGYGGPTAGFEEHIAFKGGPGTVVSTLLSENLSNEYTSKHQNANIYDTSIYTTAGLPTDYGKGTRESNLKSNFDTGVTVEFWLKKDAFDSGTDKEVILDIWNNNAATSDTYGRLAIELNRTASASPFRITARSGNVAPAIPCVHSEIGQDLTTTSLQDWGHYAFRFFNSGSHFVSKLYVNGRLNDTNIYTSSSIEEFTTSEMLGRIGALVTSPSGSVAAAGAGTLSGALDDFRFWKADRDARQIGINYFDTVGGGANTDLSNTELGIYYKFNEGITQTASVDSVVLDYAGRITNGVWTGYETNSRSTGSAIVLAGAATKEYRDPVVRVNNPHYTSLRENLLATGSWYDGNNNSSFINYSPGWVLDLHDDDENLNLKIISHIAGAYFDKIYLLAADLPKFRHASYTTASSEPIPFASHLPTSVGLYVPDLFVDSDILERITDRTESELFENKLAEIKNLIYQNLYNNITNIYKSKGTLKSIRNIMRCFNVDDELLRLKTYNKNATYEIKNSLQQQVISKNTINFNNAYNIGAVVYQKSSSLGYSSGYISGSSGDTAITKSPELLNGLTAEASFIFPNFFPTKDKFDRNFTEVSLFGLHTVNVSSSNSLSGVDTTWLATDPANFQVFAIRDEAYSSNAYFKLASLNHPIPLPELTSSVFMDVYDDSKWNLSVRIKPKDYPRAGVVAGSNYNTYDVIFRGINTELGVVKNSFEVSSSITNISGSDFVSAPKRLYVGARRENITGDVLQNSDVLAVDARYWAKFIDNDSIDLHNSGYENNTIEHSYRNLNAIDPELASQVDIKNYDALALSWNFNGVTGSNATGNFRVLDYSSGSAVEAAEGNYGWLGRIAGFQHDGYGYGFQNNATNVSKDIKINAFVPTEPETAVASDMIQILSDDDQVLNVFEVVPNYVFVIEKSMFESISKEMLNFFASAVDFNNVIGEPVNRYRSRYKDLEKLRETFYRRVTKTTNVEDYVDYYKWFDDSISTIIQQLVPASADFVENVLNTVESHVLERHKYETKFPTLESNVPDVEAGVETYSLTDNYSLGSSTVPQSPRDTTKHKLFWKLRANRSSDEITSGDSTIDSQRETYRRIISSNPFLSRSVSTQFDVKNNSTYNVNDSFKRRRYIKNFAEKVSRVKTYKGGVNFTDKKDIQFVYSSLHPAGPVNKQTGGYVPLNVLLSFMSDLVKVQTDNDPKLVTEKTKRYFKVLRGRDYEEGLGYYNLKSSMAFPFNIYTGSIAAGYQSVINTNLSGAELIITNLHNDVYGPDMEKPMQGPFTEYAVGGHQSRHVELNKGTDSSTSRPEAWKILLGTCEEIPSGAIGMVGADYPDPATGLFGEAAYPYRPHQKAVYYRDMTAKRPVNIRNIQMKTGSTILGNYRHTYDYVQAPGATANPRHLVDKQPALPDRMFVKNASSSMVARTILDIHRTTDAHTQNVTEYNTDYLDGNINKSVIISKFNAVGGIEVQSRGYQDIRAGEFSAYNTLGSRYLTVIKPSQGPSGTISTAATPGDTTNIQVFDIHGKDYGLYSHLARHTARFGRDSLFENAPGTSYTELPGFHKVHRNNLTRKEICDVVLEVQLTGSQMANAGGFDYDPDPNNGPSIGTSDASSEALISSINSAGGYPGFSWTGWVKFGHANVNVEENIVLLGSYGASKPAASQRGLLRIYKLYSAGAWKIKAELATQSGSAGTTSGSSIVWQFEAPSELTSSWGHYGVTWAAPADGQLAKVSNHNNLTIYYNGVSQSVTVEPNDNYPYYDSDVSTVSNWKNWPALDLAGNQFMCLGGDGSPGNATLSASIDEYTFWATSLSDSQVSEIYNSGVPCDITASNTYTDTAALWDWIRFEVSGGSSQINIDNGNPGNYSVGNRITGFGNQFKGIPITLRTTNNGSRQISDVPSGCSQYVYTTTEVNTICDKNVYDNFNVQHQIPRMSKQYAWITGSLVSDNDWPGFTPTNYEVKKKHLGLEDNGYTTPYSFVSASDFGSYYQYGGVNARRFGWTQFRVGVGTNFAQFIPTDFVGLNTNVIDNLNSTTNTIGTIDNNVTEYVNTTFNDGGVTPNDEAKASIFNAMMLNRHGPYGHPSWKQMRNSYNPILRNERKNNKFTNVSDLDNETLIQYDLPPVSNRAKPNMINFSVAGSPVPYTFLATDENERIYFNSTEADNQFAPPLENFVTPAEQMMVLARSGENRLNWIVYSQQIFPSIKNEFVSSSTNKIGYDNLYWRDSVSERYTVGTIFDNSTPGTAANTFKTPTGSFSSENSFGIFVSQSSWPLDPPQDFLTRRGIFTQTGSSNIDILLNNETLRFTSGAAGELQNCYMGMETVGGFGIQTAGGFPGATPLTANTTFRYSEVFNTTTASKGVIPGQVALTANHGLGSLYARKQTLIHPTSVRSPYGPDLSTGASAVNPKSNTALEGAADTVMLTGSFMDTNRFIEIGAGEAAWQAPSQAGYIRTVPSIPDENGNSRLERQFISASSSPWWDDYDSFRQDLKLKARGFSIIPEFRISENLVDYLKSDGTPPDGFGFGLEIPHVSGANAKTDQKFYTTYSNSEFLKDFLRIRDTSLLKASEIRISCTGAIRLNPYKGFYPAQRTLDLAREFKNSYKDNLTAKLNGGFFSGLIDQMVPGTGSFQALQAGYVHSTTIGATVPFNQSYALKPLIDKLFSPGILYNTIKSGIAVDYPNISKVEKISRTNFAEHTNTSHDNITGSYALDIEHGLWHSASQNNDSKELNDPWKFFDNRLPFETMIEPEKYLIGKNFFDLEANPLSALNSATASFIDNDSGPTYTKIARNFFGSVPSFFLKDQDFTTIKSALSTTTFKFKGDEVYMMRIKMNRSTKGPRTYQYEVDSIGRKTNGTALYTYGGGVALSQSNFLHSNNNWPNFNTGSTGATDGTDLYYNLPQDPRFNPSFKETFTMYSRPTAFGPPICGRASGSSDQGSPAAYSTASLDSFSGFNPAFTPPYYNGEAWCDLIFRPSASIEYTLRDVMSETQTQFWRFDAGPLMRTAESGRYARALIAGTSSIIVPTGDYQTFPKEFARHPYGGSMINDSSMQLSASLNMFGLETEVFEERDKFGVLQTTRPGTTVGDRWVIKPKFETPMMNFSDVSEVMPRPISQNSGSVELPLYGSSSVPHGMWHQFGSIPTDNEGVFVTVGDVPEQWLNNHYLVKDFKSIYNDSSPAKNYASKVKSLADLVGFNTQTQAKLGVLKDKTVIREAIVAVPYIIEQPKKEISDANQAENAARKSFIKIPKQRFEAARLEAFGSKLGDSLDAAGPSISKQLQKMNRYILPPQLDFLNNPEGAAEPFVMYMFEFEYEFDKDDLSYIWQNLAPRDYKKMEMKYQSVAHELVDTELLNETILKENQSLRWMIFKVKQKGQEDYWDYVANQVDKNTTTPKQLAAERGQYKFDYNWPYDYVSFVEMIKMSADIKFEQDPMQQMSLVDTSLKTKNIQSALPAPVASAGVIASMPTVEPLSSVTMPMPTSPTPVQNQLAGRAATRSMALATPTPTAPSSEGTPAPTTPMRGPGTGRGGGY